MPKAQKAKIQKSGSKVAKLAKVSPKKPAPSKKKGGVIAVAKGAIGKLASTLKGSAPKAAAPAKEMKANGKAHPVAAAPAAPVALTKPVKVPRAKRASSPRLNPEDVCREIACEGLATSNGYCRLHYIKNWKKIKRKELILKEKKLNQYIEELVIKYPDKYIEAIRQDLANDKDFSKVIHDLDLDEGVEDFDVEGESADVLIDTIKRDFEDDGDAF